MGKFAVIGLGKFGYTVATTLQENKADVIAIDYDQNLIDNIAGKVTTPVRMNSTNEEDLKKIGIQDVDAAILAIGNNLEVSVLTAVILKKLGVAKIYAKVDSKIHGRILEMLGIPHENIIFPEEVVGKQLANSLISTSVKQYVDLMDGYAMIDLEAPEEWFGKTLQELALPTQKKVNVITIRYMESIVSEQGDITFRQQVNELPGANDVIHEGDTIVLVGNESKIVDLVNEFGKQGKK
ncbi:MAG: TrkA family potassium uptake protein [Candidatus Cloacimonetes bacterium]|nr:TrkA family potassium uptake protein [Candidatus Cloacimonadota bacterium]